MLIRLSKLSLLVLPLMLASTSHGANAICSVYQKQIQGVAVGCESTNVQLQPATVTSFHCLADGFHTELSTPNGDTYTVTANSFGSGTLQQVNYTGEMAGGPSIDAGPGYIGGVFQFAADGTPTLGVSDSTKATYCQIMEFVTYGAQECCQ